MLRTLGIALLGFVGLVLVVAAFGPGLPPPEAPLHAPRLTTPAIERAVDECRLLLGLRDDTVMTHERMALFARCMRPELKQVSVSK